VQGGAQVREFGGIDIFPLVLDEVGEQSNITLVNGIKDGRQFLLVLILLLLLTMEGKVADIAILGLGVRISVLLYNSLLIEGGGGRKWDVSKDDHNDHIV